MIEEHDNSGIEENPGFVNTRARKKFKPKRSLGQAITRKRRQQMEAVEKRIEDRKRREREAARQELERLKNRSKNEAKTKDNRQTWAADILRNVATGQAALLKSWGFTQPINVSIDPRANEGAVVAWTDFKKISVTWPLASFPDSRFDTIGMLDTVAQMKGIIQHEMGHLRFTTPWGEVLEHVSLPKGRDAHKMHTCWNMLEDQRMECLVVKSVPRIANYFGTMVANVVLNAGMVPAGQVHLMTAGREYLPANVRRQAFLAFDQFCFDQGIKDGALTWSTLVDNYRKADSYKSIMKAVTEALDFIEKIRATMPPAMDDHDEMGEEGNADLKDTSRQPGSILDLFADGQPPKPSKKGESSNAPGKPCEGEGQDGSGKEQNREDYSDRQETVGGGGAGKPDKDQGKDKGNGQGAGDGEAGDEEGEGQGSGKGESDKSESQNRDGAPGQTNHGEGLSSTSEGSLEEALSKMSESFKSAIRKDRDLSDAVSKSNTSADSAGLPEYSHHDCEMMSGELMASAKYTAEGIKKALQTFVTQNEPMWKNHQERGIIDPLAYRTKNVGEYNFRRHLEDRGNTGLDVHVSMLCDVSGSMGGWYGQGGSHKSPIVALSESLYATALACDELGIGATYTLWSSDTMNYRVWKDGTPTPTLWPCMGGTDPTKALDDLDSHNPDERENHLVVIFTDGAWAHNFPSLTRWAKPGRTFVLVRYSGYDGDMQKDMGADSHINIQRVEDLPNELTKALIDVLSEGGW